MRQLCAGYKNSGWSRWAIGEGEEEERAKERKEGITESLEQKEEAKGKYDDDNNNDDGDDDENDDERGSKKQ